MIKAGPYDYQIWRDCKSNKTVLLVFDGKRFGFAFDVSFEPEGPEEEMPPLEYTFEIRGEFDSGNLSRSAMNMLQQRLIANE